MMSAIGVLALLVPLNVFVFLAVLAVTDSATLAVAACIVPDGLYVRWLRRRRPSNNHYDKGLALLAQGQHEQAITEFNHAIRDSPSAANLFFIRGSAYVAKNEHDAALADANRALELDARCAGATWCDLLSTEPRMTMNWHSTMLMRPLGMDLRRAMRTSCADLSLRLWVNTTALFRI